MEQNLKKQKQPFFLLVANIVLTLYVDLNHATVIKTSGQLTETLIENDVNELGFVAKNDNATPGINEKPNCKNDASCNQVSASDNERSTVSIDDHRRALNVPQNDVINSENLLSNEDDFDGIDTDYRVEHD